MIRPPGASSMLRPALSVLAASLALAACSTTPSWMSPAPPPEPPPAASAPPAPGIATEDLVGRWGFASFQREADRGRTTNQARGQCGNPYVINRGPGGGVLMHLPDTAAPVELRTKGGPDSRRYIGPEGPAGDPLDREIVSFDGRIMVLRWIDPEVAGRYGTSVYVRCAPRAGGGPRPARRQAPRPPAAPQ
ncbi:MAG: hypothetical protein IT538_03390 [Variibacter sp.]|nr:hypothetical protein [Variibacter sp.]